MVVQISTTQALENMIRLRYVSIVAVLLLGACSPVARQPRANSEIAALLAGFQFYDAMDRRTQATSQLEAPSDIGDVKAGAWYRFRREQGGISEGELGCRVLPERLRTQGFRILNQPSCNSGQGFIHVDPGGIIFSVVAVRGGCELTISQSHIVPQPWWWRFERSGKWAEAVLLVSGRNC